MIVIDHENGYQTRYMHMQDEGLITKTPGEKIRVTAGQPIGKVGATGYVDPAGEAGAHIHFMVVQDKNKDGNFGDNIPDGATDPFGWQSKEPDPWESYNFFYAGLNRTGNKSYYLWKNNLDNLDETLTSNGGVFKVGKHTVSFPQEITDQDLNLQMKSTPNIKINNSLISLGSTIYIQAKDAFGNLITTYPKFFEILVDFKIIDLSRFKTSTLKFYSSSDGITWVEEPTEVDLENKTAKISVNHLSYFALVGERVDTVPPTTTAELTGTKGLDNWFRSDVQLKLNVQDNEGGLGVDYTLYKLENSDWQIYNGPLNFSSEGHIKVEFYSADNDENLEEVKSVEFDIDKTRPQVWAQADPLGAWPPNGKTFDVTVNGTYSDDHLSQAYVSVYDDYKEIEPVIVQTTSPFTQVLTLESSRWGTEKRGRKYIINLVAEDLAGNSSMKQIKITIEHDQGEGGV